jgi:hypothetical protein
MSYNLGFSGKEVYRYSRNVEHYKYAITILGPTFLEKLLSNYYSTDIESHLQYFSIDKDEFIRRVILGYVEKYWINRDYENIIRLR